VGRHLVSPGWTAKRAVDAARVHRCTPRVDQGWPYGSRPLPSPARTEVWVVIVVSGQPCGSKPLPSPARTEVWEVIVPYSFQPWPEWPPLGQSPAPSPARQWVEMRIVILLRSWWMAGVDSPCRGRADLARLYRVNAAPGGWVTTLGWRCCGRDRSCSRWGRTVRALRAGDSLGGEAHRRRGYVCQPLSSMRTPAPARTVVWICIVLLLVLEADGPRSCTAGSPSVDLQPCGSIPVPSPAATWVFTFILVSSSFRVQPLGSMPRPPPAATPLRIVIFAPSRWWVNVTRGGPARHRRAWCRWGPA
jgi:hypothetical protein